MRFAIPEPNMFTKSVEPVLGTRQSEFSTCLEAVNAFQLGTRQPGFSTRLGAVIAFQDNRYYTKSLV